MKRAQPAVLLLLLLLPACGPAPAPTTVPAPATTRAAAALPAATLAPTPTSVPPTATPAPTLPPTHTGPQPPAQAALGETWLRPADGMVMVYVPAGTFVMGIDEAGPHVDPAESPAHTVTLDGFWIDRTEVTCGQFAAFLNARGNRTANGSVAARFGAGYIRIEQVGTEYRARPYAVDYPVVMVTWYGAQEYCQWAGGRLPTEAEWEYAARGPEGRLYPWGDDAPGCDRANFGDCGRNLEAVGTRPAGASWCGAQEMAGGAWEWTADWYGPYPTGSQDNPAGPEVGTFKVMRGGGWHSPWWEIRTTARMYTEVPASYNG